METGLTAIRCINVYFQMKCWFLFFLLTVVSQNWSSQQTAVFLSHKNPTELQGGNLNVVVLVTCHYRELCLPVRTLPQEAQTVEPLLGSCMWLEQSSHKKTFSLRLLRKWVSQGCVLPLPAINLLWQKISS